MKNLLTNWRTTLAAIAKVAASGAAVVGSGGSAKGLAAAAILYAVGEIIQSVLTADASIQKPQAK